MSTFKTKQSSSIKIRFLIEDSTDSTLPYPVHIQTSGSYARSLASRCGFTAHSEPSMIRKLVLSALLPIFTSVSRLASLLWLHLSEGEDLHIHSLGSLRVSSASRHTSSITSETPAMAGPVSGARKNRSITALAKATLRHALGPDTIHHGFLIPRIEIWQLPGLSPAYHCNFPKHSSGQTWVSHRRQMQKHGPPTVPRGVDILSIAVLGGRRTQA